MSSCIQCGNMSAKHTYKYCSNKCQADYQYYDYVARWKKGEVSGVRGVNTKNISAHIKRYLFDKYSGSCSACSWDKRNEATNESPLEIDHIDGNSENNSESNLRLLCPNCHSLTIKYKNLNKGMGRSWRRLKYLKSA